MPVTNRRGKTIMRQLGLAIAIICMLLHSPLAFDASTYELWVPLLRGGTVVVAPRGELDVETLRRMVAEHGVTGLWLTSGLFRIVVQEAPGCLDGVREVWTGGDSTGRQLLKSKQERSMEREIGSLAQNGYETVELVASLR